VRIETGTKANRWTNISTKKPYDSLFVHAHAIPLPARGGGEYARHRSCLMAIAGYHAF
jgi:hypothetical protein